ncbi:hypothetical protein NDU88_005751 [Pleurodeles waltl]|uniref:Uncharacterized protein n=1 Tax=Pleurodeles waltl TaxID=8319 RepID=A0AAV7TDJ6_PLEWA|nr:hypothetical protein NDU88_005751 [Pleurodeles waltl]
MALTWCINKFAFWDLALWDSIRESVDHYFKENNNTGNIFPAPIWDVAKAVLRSELIAHAATLIKLAKAKKADLEARLYHLEAQHKTTGPPKVHRELQRVRGELEQLYMTDEAWKLLYVNHKYYEKGTKPTNCWHTNWDKSKREIIFQS